MLRVGMRAATLRVACRRYAQNALGGTGTQSVPPMGSQAALANEEKLRNCQTGLSVGVLAPLPQWDLAADLDPQRFRLRFAQAVQFFDTQTRLDDSPLAIPIDHRRHGLLNLRLIVHVFRSTIRVVDQVDIRGFVAVVTFVKNS